MKAVKYIAAVLLVVMIGVTASYAVSKGDKAPDFKLKTIDGKTLSLTNLRKGSTKLVLVDLWATNCDPCVAEIPHVQRLYKKYGPRGLVVVGIAGYRGDTVEDVKSFVKKNKMSYPIVMDSDKRVSRQYGMRWLPTMYAIDKSGVIRNVHIGYTEPEVLESEIKAFLK